MSMTDGFPAFDVPEVWIDGVEHVEFEGGGTIRVWLYVRRPGGGQSHDVKIALRGSLGGLQDIIKKLALFTANGAIGQPQGTA